MITRLTLHGAIVVATTITVAVVTTCDKEQSSCMGDNGSYSGKIEKWSEEGEE